MVAKHRLATVLKWFCLLLAIGCLCAFLWVAKIFHGWPSEIPILTDFQKQVFQTHERYTQVANDVLFGWRVLFICSLVLAPTLVFAAVALHKKECAFIER